MADDDDLDLDPSGSEEPEEDLDGGERTPDAATFKNYDSWLTAQMKQRQRAGEDSYNLGQIRKAVRKVGEQVEAAERRGWETARTALAVDDVREEVRAELRTSEERARNLRRYAVPAELEPLFADLNGDYTAWQQRAAELQARGIRWDAPPSGPIVEEQAQQAARDRAIADAVTQAQTTQAGGLPANSQPTLQQRAQAARQRPGGPNPEEALAIAQEFNADLDALARHVGGEW